MSPGGLGWKQDNCEKEVCETHGKNKWGGDLMELIDDYHLKKKILTRARSLRARRRLARRTALKMLPRKEKKAAAKAKMVLRRKKGRCQP